MNPKKYDGLTIDQMSAEIDRLYNLQPPLDSIDYRNAVQLGKIVDDHFLSRKQDLNNSDSSILLTSNPPNEKATLT